jgi:hypothetical protein
MANILKELMNNVIYLSHREKQSIKYIDGLPKVWVAKTSIHTSWGMKVNTKRMRNSAASKNCELYNL